MGGLVGPNTVNRPNTATCSVGSSEWARDQVHVPNYAAWLEENQVALINIKSAPDYDFTVLDCLMGAFDGDRVPLIHAHAIGYRIESSQYQPIFALLKLSQGFANAFVPFPVCLNS